MLKKRSDPFLFMPTKKLEYTFDTRVSYADTDRMGVVYYGNYFTLFEKGRTELMRNIGLRYRDMEEKDKIFLPVNKTTCEYFAPAQYDDLIKIKTWVDQVKGAHIDFKYEITNADNGTKLAAGYTRHPFVNKDWRPVRPPKRLRDLFK